jgi:hypothetical protein
MTEPETIEAEVEEQMGQALEVAAPAPVNLFRTDDPGEVVRKATATATVLKQVLVEQDLISIISGKEHVKAEGWTLLGTMLGVFPVCVWTKPVGGDQGWEARVEARTLAGAVVGAAEAECLRSEKEWGPNPTRGGMRDDFALRSMAQTRATSKALRQPLGFIVKMAGFDATPAEEIVKDEERRQEGPRPDPPPKSWQGKNGIRERLEGGSDTPDVWELFLAFARAAAIHLWGPTEEDGSIDLKKLTQEQKNVHLQKAATVVVWLMEEVEPSGAGFYSFDQDTMRRAWARVVDGHALEIPDYVAPEPEPSEISDYDEEVERLADEAIVGPSE